MCKSTQPSDMFESDWFVSSLLYFEFYLCTEAEHKVNSQQQLVNQENKNFEQVLPAQKNETAQLSKAFFIPKFI